MRGPLRHYVGSTVMTWVYLDRGVRLAGLLGDESAPAHRWRRAADEVRAQVLDRVIEELCGGRSACSRRRWRPTARRWATTRRPSPIWG
ncbi:hypothetical protein [Nonomuraea harbinensis]|uniref:Uncharacterized protein n=1 Tax=Nonomuraea harbinensis TaxID=1286938 RepID=A0ABW1C0J6_9ACTN|nr:hypothetical protein [Nonomuraea harbinensis]